MKTPGLRAVAASKQYMRRDTRVRVLSWGAFAAVAAFALWSFTTWEASSPAPIVPTDHQVSSVTPGASPAGSGVAEDGRRERADTTSKTIEKEVVVSVVDSRGRPCPALVDVYRLVSKDADVSLRWVQLRRDDIALEESTWTDANGLVSVRVGGHAEAVCVRATAGFGRAWKVIRAEAVTAGTIVLHLIEDYECAISVVDARGVPVVGVGVTAQCVNENNENVGTDVMLGRTDARGVISTPWVHHIARLQGLSSTIRHGRLCLAEPAKHAPILFDITLPPRTSEIRVATYGQLRVSILNAAAGNRGVVALRLADDPDSRPFVRVADAHGVVVFPCVECGRSCAVRYISFLSGGGGASPITVRGPVGEGDVVSAEIRLQDAPRVTMVLLNDGMALAKRTVVVANSDLELLVQCETDADGIATVTLPRWCSGKSMEYLDVGSDDMIGRWVGSRQLAIGDNHVGNVMLSELKENAGPGGVPGRVTNIDIDWGPIGGEVASALTVVIDSADGDYENVRPTGSLRVDASVVRYGFVDLANGPHRIRVGAMGTSIPILEAGVEVKGNETIHVKCEEGRVRGVKWIRVGIDATGLREQDGEVVIGIRESGTWMWQRINLDSVRRCYSWIGVRGPVDVAVLRGGARMVMLPGVYEDATVHLRPPIPIAVRVSGLIDVRGVWIEPIDDRGLGEQGRNLGSWVVWQSDRFGLAGVPWLGKYAIKCLTSGTAGVKQIEIKTDGVEIVEEGQVVEVIASDGK